MRYASFVIGCLLVGCGSSSSTNTDGNTLSGPLAFPVRGAFASLGSSTCNSVTLSGSGVSFNEFCNADGRNVSVIVETADGGVSPGTYNIDPSTCAQGFSAKVEYQAATADGGFDFGSATSGHITIDSSSSDAVKGSFEAQIALPDGGSGELSGTFDRSGFGTCYDQTHR